MVSTLWCSMKIIDRMTGLPFCVNYQSFRVVLKIQIYIASLILKIRSPLASFVEEVILLACLLAVQSMRKNISRWDHWDDLVY